MRKFFAILLLSVHIFSLGGYHLVLNYFEQKADNSLVKKLDNNDYNEAQLITIKMPLHLPYINNSEDFERCDGTVKINGVYYNYVKRKMSNDTLILQCIANNEKNKICAANNDYKKIFGNTQSSSNDKPISALLKIFFSDNYYVNHDDSLLSLTGNIAKHEIRNDNNRSNPFLSLTAQPPDFSAA